MSVLMSEERNELIITCDCGCDNACHIKCHIKFDNELKEYNSYTYMSFMRNDWYSGRDHSVRDKLKRIWRVIRGEDYCYSDIVMKKEDWEIFREWVNTREL